MSPRLSPRSPLCAYRFGTSLTFVGSPAAPSHNSREHQTGINQCVFASVGVQKQSDSWLGHRGHWIRRYRQYAQFYVPSRHFLPSWHATSTVALALAEADARGPGRLTYFWPRTWLTYKAMPEALSRACLVRQIRAEAVEMSSASNSSAVILCVLLYYCIHTKYFPVEETFRPRGTALV
jgi:hypothetical protein